MVDSKTTERVRVVDIVSLYGQCVELVSIDPNFHDITVGLYEKAGTFTVWTYSHKPGVQKRIGVIRGQLAVLGGLEPVEGAHDRARFACGQIHRRPVKFLMMQAVEKDPSHRLPEGRVKDLRSALMLGFEGAESEGRWVYRVTSEGEAPNPDGRLRAVTAGFVRYGEMERVENGVAFACGYRHDELVQILLPYARNVTQVEDALEAEALRGQMTTGTLGFAPPT